MTLKDLHQGSGYTDDTYHKRDVTGGKKKNRDFRKKENKVLETAADEKKKNEHTKQ